MAPIILGNPAGVGNVDNIIVPYKDQYRLAGRGAGVAIGNTADTRVFSTGTVILAGTNLTISTSALGAHQYLNLSIADPAAAANYVVAGDNILLSTSGVATTISVTGLQPAGAYLTTAALSNHNHGGGAFATGNIGGTIGSYTYTSLSGTDTVTQTTQGWSLSIPDFLVTAALSDHSHSNYAGIGATTATTSGTDVKATLSTNGLSLRTPRYLTTAAQISHTHGGASGTNITIGSSSNGLALSVGNYITTAAPVTHIHGSISTISTTGSDITYTSASNGLTLGVPQWITTVDGGNNLTLSGNTAGTLTEMNSGTVTIVGGDNITLSQSGNAFTIIGAASGTNAGVAFSLSSSNTTGTAVLLSSGTIYMEGGNNVTVSQENNTIRFIGNSTFSNVAGLGTTTNSITGTDLKLTLSTDGLNLEVPAWITNAGSLTASNAVYAGDNISLSTEGVNTTVSVVGLQATSNMSLYQQTSESSLFQLVANSSLSLGTGAANSFLNTAFSTLLQHTTDNSLSLAISQSSLFQLVADNSLSLGTTYTSHTHSNLYIALSESSLYRTSVLSNTFAVLSHTHSNLYLPISYSSHTHNYLGTNSAVTGASLTANTSGISINIPQREMYFSDANGISFGGSISGYSTTISGSINVLATDYTSHTHSQYLTTAMLSNMTSVLQYTSNISNITSAAINTSEVGSLYFVNSLGTNLTWSSTYSSNSTYIGASVNAGNGNVSWELEGNNTAGTTGSSGSILYLSAGNNVTLSGNSNTIVVSVNATGANDGVNIIAAGTQTANTTGTVLFSNSNGITFGMSGNTRVTASYSQSTHDHPYINTSISSNFLTTAALSNHSHGNISLALTNISGTTASASNGMTLSLSANTAAGGNFIGTGISTSGNITVTANTVGLSITAPTLGYLYFSNANGHSWSSSTNGVSTSIYLYTA
jgi:hypothetical protein